MRYRLRTLLIWLALGPAIVAGSWWYGKWIAENGFREGLPFVAFNVFWLLAVLAILASVKILNAIENLRGK